MPDRSQLKIGLVNPKCRLRFAQLNVCLPQFLVAPIAHVRAKQIATRAERCPIGLIFNLAGAFWLGVIFYGLMVLFSIVTLPVEFNASSRGRKLLREAGLMVTQEDESGSQRVLMAAASTYVAAAVTAILQLLYYISIGRRRR